MRTIFHGSVGALSVIAISDNAGIIFSITIEAAGGGPGGAFGVLEAESA
jgi:hypothetical protein